MSKLPGAFWDLFLQKESRVTLNPLTSIPSSFSPPLALCSFNYFAPQLGRSEHLAPEWLSAPKVPSVGSEADGQWKSGGLGDRPWGKSSFCSAALI